MQKTVNTIFKYSFSTALLILIIIGIKLRIDALNFSLDIYFDEMALLNNIVDRRILNYFTILDDNQCCPPFFMIFGKILYLFFGYNPKTLRTATGFIPSILSLFAFIYLCFIVFKNKLSIIFSVFLFTFQIEIIRQAGMFKPYSFDTLITSIIVISILKLDKIKEKLLPKHYFILGLLAGIAILCSYPSMYIILSSFCIILLREYIVNKHINIKNTFCFLIPFTIIFLFLLFKIFIPTANNLELQEYWTNIEPFLPINYWQTIDLICFLFTQNYIFSIIVFIVSFAYMFQKNKFLCGLIYLPILINFLTGFLKIYPMSGRTILYLLPLSFILFSYPIEKVNFAKSNQLHINILILLLYFSFTNFSGVINKEKANRNFSTYTTGEYYYNALKNIDISEKKWVLLTQEQSYVFESLYTRYTPPQEKKNLKLYYTRISDVLLLDKSDIIMYYPMKSYLENFVLEESSQDIDFLEDIIKNHCSVLLTKNVEYGTLIECKFK